MNDVTSALLPAEDSVLRIVGMMVLMCLTLYLIAFILRRLWRRMQTHVDVIIERVVRREMSKSFEIMLMRIVECHTDVAVFDNRSPTMSFSRDVSHEGKGNAARAPPSLNSTGLLQIPFHMERRVSSVSSFGVADPRYLKGLPVDPRPSEASFHTPEQALPLTSWIIPFKESVRRFRTLQLLPLLHDQELDDIANCCVDQIVRQCWYIRKDLVKRLVQHATLICYHEYHQQLIAECLQFVTAVHRFLRR